MALWIKTSWLNSFILLFVDFLRFKRAIKIFRCRNSYKYEKTSFPKKTNSFNNK
ncbi:hypothetical protein LEP1GSC107_3406 [Leptospira interrogans serovar Grippotyphosa str. UI 12769]|uniref:Uncharacterized protein n=2 Tax=Leptospira interrogans TaxID=173 RepID=M6G324_LEPIR|nr:hypothetical protein LEP1GSC009_0511 [Leptospira interrogans serovar Grippotyphosa str. Andaman]EKO94604.1 hypothetical protein LEP1GSC057_2539 [Leptospira interrogans str. Brem 329]EKR29196.1 hypothetical protein LEP1GSC087_2451 [Leptospira interrogans serovar Bataviae str. L1111]EKR46154.1 hypothetical protein LEP1GSC097_1893 [Leptospira interrogans serovar Grippotyphosa str. UI 08368]EMG19677.1 hypothetical protein LEP1GSC150_1042 [Leptospira interrogans serovar Copenhageni str. LT2050]E